MGSTRTWPDTARWGRRSRERSRATCVGPFGEAQRILGRTAIECWAARSKWSLRLRAPVDRAARAHVLGFVVVLGVALGIHYGILPFLVRRVGIREVLPYFLALSLVPVAPLRFPCSSCARRRGES